MISVLLLQIGLWPAVYNIGDFETIKKGENKANLDPNHSHFILVDDGSEGKWESEIGFRTKLEKSFKDAQGILTVSFNLIKISQCI